MAFLAQGLEGGAEVEPVTEGSILSITALPLFLRGDANADGRVEHRDMIPAG